MKKKIKAFLIKFIYLPIKKWFDKENKNCHETIFLTKNKPEFSFFI